MNWKPLLGIFVSSPLIFSSISCGSSNEGKRINIDLNQNTLHEFKIVNNSSLNEGVISNLKSLLSSYLNYGPEVFLLKEIRIIEDGTIPNLEEAATFSSTQTIAINAKILKGLELTNDIDDALYLFELIYHEYMHFVADNYFNNISSSNPNIDASIDINNPGNNEDKEHWSKSFLEAFKNDFQYNQIIGKKEPNTLIENKYVSIASKYEAKDLYDIANSNQLTYNKLQGNEVMTSSHPSRDLITFWKSQNINPVIKEESLKYLYSMQELFARKAELATCPIFATVNTKSNNFEGFNLEHWINLKNKHQFWSPILQDVLNFSDSLNGYDYLSDGIKSDFDYSPLFLSQWENKDEISLLTYQNNTSLTMDGQENINVDHSKIAIGGYLPNSKFKYIGFEESGHFTSFKLNIENDYYLSEFINAPNIKGKILEFSNDDKGTERQKISKIYHDFGNEISSNRDYDSSQEDYQIIKNNNGVSLEVIN